MNRRSEATDGPGTPTGAALFRQAQAGCRDSLARLMAAHEKLVHAVVRKQVLGDLPLPTETRPIGPCVAMTTAVAPFVRTGTPSRPTASMRVANDASGSVLRRASTAPSPGSLWLGSCTRPTRVPTKRRLVPMARSSTWGNGSPMAPSVWRATCPWALPPGNVSTIEPGMLRRPAMPPSSGHFKGLPVYGGLRGQSPRLPGG